VFGEQFTGGSDDAVEFFLLVPLAPSERHGGVLQE